MYLNILSHSLNFGNICSEKTKCDINFGFSGTWMSHPSETFWVGSASSIIIRSWEEHNNIFKFLVFLCTIIFAKMTMSLPLLPRSLSLKFLYKKQ
jgi:hypothetical protein